MPDITVINDIDENIHVAFFVGVPTNWKNNLKPGERWTTHLASLPLHFEVRWAHRIDFDTGNIWCSQEFSHNDSMEMFATIGGACAAGTASVVSAGGLLACDMVVGIPIISGPLMAVANAGGAKYGDWRADVRLCTARVWVPFWNKQYSVRMVEGRGCVLWDVDDNAMV
ncbi:hypothetical protein DEU56DRAFT_558801 [Suillus clintonianus]|uniref:uncharacterized protein n=1 Tax=Suillus clintonianus TaxID=1904413 RepID=UPI001B879272|nr:uncharacterized protein DEU56DRAFT_558801 [Suillus clintonianus]KAG2126061.1 hypothetical protein DEU56DRAFT_558801 [Suillus clintonianus]